MPDINQDKQALDWLTQNPNDQRSSAVMNKLGIEPVDVQAWQYASQNPDDERSTQIRNKIYDKVAASNPATETQGVGFIDRLAIKNLINENTDLQQNYLKRKGYETRVVGDRVEVRRPGQSRFQVIDPEGFDVWDVTDVANDAVEAIAGAFATGAKALGALGAPVTGGASLLAGSALGGAATAGVEGLRQGIGIATGLREDIDPGQIAQAGAAGAIVPGAAKLLGSAFKATGRGAASLARVGRKAESEAIEKAAKEIGAEATPGQVLDSALIQRLESAQAQSSGKLGGIGLRQQIQKNIKATQEAADDIVKEASGRTSFEVGQQAESRLTEELAERLKPAEAIYQKYEGIFSRKAYKPQLESVKTSLNEMKKDFRLNDDALKLIDKFEQKLPELKNLEDVKQFRTLVRDSFNPLDKANARITTKLGNDLTQVRSDTLKELAKTRGDDFFDVAKKEIEQADRIYKGSIDDIKAAILRPGQKVKFSPKKQVKDFLEKTPEIDRINKILKTNDPKKIAAVKRAFPLTFDALRRGKIQEIATRAETSGAVNPRKLANIIGKLPPETSRLIFGSGASEKAKALKTFLDSVPPMVGPSGTPSGIEIFRMFNLLSQSASVGRDVFRKSLERLGTGRDILTRTGTALQAPAARGLGIAGARGLMPPPRDNRGLQLRE